MPIAQISASDVEALLARTGLNVSGTYSWQQAAHKAWLKAEIPVNDSGRVNLRIVITVNKLEPSLHSFALIMNNAFRIRALDIEGSHANKHTNRQKWAAETHKHKWTDPCRDRFAYTPDDIHSSDIQGQLAEFCGECNIRCEARLTRLPPLGGLLDEV